MPKRIINWNGNDLALDARPDRLDIRDLPYRPPVQNLPPSYPVDIKKSLSKYSKLILKQGKEGACTGFALAAVINYLLWSNAPKKGEKFHKRDQVSQRMLYHLARFYDEWDGEDYEGSSCRGALKGWQRHGVCQESLWHFKDGRFIQPKDGWDIDALMRPLGIYYRIQHDSVVDMQAAIYQIGAIYVSANIHEGWKLTPNTDSSPTDEEAELPIIPQEKRASILGGHAFALIGYNSDGFVVQNSWGADWGWHGFAILPYDDWVENSSDAWVAALGVPVKRNASEIANGILPKSPQHYVPSSTRRRVESAGIDWFRALTDPLQQRQGVWDYEKAYFHTLVTGNDGNIINRILKVNDLQGSMRIIATEDPEVWFRNNCKDSPSWDLAIYAHGGLVSEEDSINRIRVLGPIFEEHKIYPIFVTWRSGPFEVIGQMLLDLKNKLLGQVQAPARGLGEEINEAWDRAVEVGARITCRGFWLQMKQNISESSLPGHGLQLLAKQVAELSNISNGKLKIHVAAHSAGALVCGELLPELAKRGLSPATCTLFAPACDLAFALERFGKLDRKNFQIHVLSDKLENNDTAFIYGKSLLYLVSRAFESWHKTPLLGLATVFDSKYAKPEFWYKDAVDGVKAWQKFFWDGISPQPSGFAENGDGLKSERLILENSTWTSTGAEQVKSGHGSFDNSLTHITFMLENIRGEKIQEETIGRVD